MKNNKFFDTELLVNVGNQMLEMVAKKYKEVQNLQHPVVPNQNPGFLRNQLPQQAPLEGESLEQILKDTENIVNISKQPYKLFPGSTFWCHPNFYAYYPCNISHAAVIGEIFSLSFQTPGFLWIISPIQTELENIVSDWIAQALNLPEQFLIKNSGGGSISTTVSDSVFVTVHVAKV